MHMGQVGHDVTLLSGSLLCRFLQPERRFALSKDNETLEPALKRFRGRQRGINKRPNPNHSVVFDARTCAVLTGVEDILSQDKTPKVRAFTRHLESRNSEAPVKAYGLWRLPGTLEFGPRKDVTQGLTMFRLMGASVTVVSTVSQKQFITAAHAWWFACESNGQYDFLRTHKQDQSANDQWNA